MVLALAAALMVAGMIQLRNVPVDVYPEFAPPYVEIQTEALGLSAAEVEQLVTVPMEELLQGVPWLQTMRSDSIPGLSSIVLIFEPGTDLMRARALVQERLTQAHGLPTANVSKPPVMLQPLSSTSRVMMIGLSSEQMSLIDMSVLTRWTIRPRLMGVPGVANVAVWGMRQRQLQVQVDPARLQANNLSLRQIIETAGNALWVSPLKYLTASTPGITGGFVDTPNQRLGVRHIVPISSPDDLAQVNVAGTQLRLGDVTDVVEDHQPLIGDAVVNGGAGLILIVEKFPWANTLDVTRGVEEALAALDPGLQGITVDPTIFRPATFIEMAIDNLTWSLLIGLLLVVLVLIAFLFEWRTAIISIVTIPLALLAAALVLHWRGETMNTMILAGLVIALGAVVDDAIVDIENIARRLRQRHGDASDRPISEVILAASLEVRGAIVFATLIVVLAVIPVFFLDGLSGAFFRPLAFSYALALLASMLVALTVTPALALFFLSKEAATRREAPLIRWLQSGYNRLLARTIRAPRAVFALVVLVVVAGLAVTPFLGQSLLPSFKETDLLVDWNGAPGTSHPEMARITQESAKELRAIPGVRNFGAHIGRAVMGDEIVGINSTESWVSVDPAADYDATVAAVQQAVNGYAGIDREVLTYLRERTRDALTGTSDAIVVRLYGPELPTLRQKAEDVRQALVGIEGVIDLKVEAQVEEPTVEIEVDLAKAEPYGLKPGDVRRAAATLVNGLEVGNLFEEQKVFEVVVVGTPDLRNSVTSLRELMIETAGGERVRMEDVANIRIMPQSNIIKREGQHRRIDVSLNVQGRDLGAVAREVNQRLQNVQFPLEYHPEVLGEYAERQAAQNRLLGLAVAAAIGIFLLLQAAFGSWRLATLAFLTLPSALVGGVIAAYLGGGVISLGSLVGFLAVLGIAARTGIMLISHYQHLEHEEGETFGPELVLRGARERIAPIMMTTAATALALVPLVVAGNIPGHEIEHPMAIVILGGLITSTLLNLFVVPALYLRFGYIREPDTLELSFPQPMIMAPAFATAAVGVGPSRYDTAILKPVGGLGNQSPEGELDTDTSAQASHPGTTSNGNGSSERIESAADEGRELELGSSAAAAQTKLETPEEAHRQQLEQTIELIGARYTADLRTLGESFIRFYADELNAKDAQIAELNRHVGLARVERDESTARVQQLADLGERYARDLSTMSELLSRFIADANAKGVTSEPHDPVMPPLQAMSVGESGRQ
jgi:CzcA family heavy metal efflux pump